MKTRQNYLSRTLGKRELFGKLMTLGFTYEEAVSLRRIEMTLHGWATAECNGEIKRDAETGKPGRVSSGRSGVFFPIADREAGALRRLKAIVDARNGRRVKFDPFAASVGAVLPPSDAPEFIVPYHQTDPRGCALYLCIREQIRDSDINSTYYRGLAVCA